MQKMTYLLVIKKVMVMKMKFQVKGKRKILKEKQMPQHKEKSWIKDQIQSIQDFTKTKSSFISKEKNLEKKGKKF